MESLVRDNALPKYVPHTQAFFLSYQLPASLNPKKGNYRSRYMEAEIGRPLRISIVNKKKILFLVTSRDHTFTEPSRLDEMNRFGSPTVPGTPLIPGYSASDPTSFM
jgi:hypothetical protein